MQRAYRLALSKVTAIGGLLIASPALAHIDLLDPPARAHGTAASGDMAVDMNADQKSGPCGQVNNGRTTDRVTTYAPGETITIRVREETPHDSYLRVLIDLDGDDGFEERPGPVVAETQEQAQAAEDALGNDGLLEVVRETNNMANFEHLIEVTLPNETCNNCTLQVIQLMFNSGQTYYYQCADIVIADGGGSGADAGAGGAGGAGTSTGAANASSGASGAATAGSSGAAGAASGGQAGSAAAGAAGSAPMGSAGSGSVDAEEASEDDGGCTLSTSSTSGSPSASLFGLLALSLGLMRRRR